MLGMRTVDALVVVSLGALAPSVLTAGAVSSLAFQIEHAPAAALRARPSVDVVVAVSQAYCNQQREDLTSIQTDDCFLWMKSMTMEF